MAFLTINTHDYQVQSAGGAQEDERAFAGEKARSFDNSLRSTRMTPKRVFSGFSLGPMSEATYQQLLTDAGSDTPRTVTGSFIAAPITAIVSVLRGLYVRDGNSFLRVAEISIEQV